MKKFKIKLIFDPLDAEGHFNCLWLEPEITSFWTNTIQELEFHFEQQNKGVDFEFQIERGRYVVLAEAETREELFRNIEELLI